MSGDQMNDQQATVQSLKDVVSQFVNERHWQEYHTPKNLVMSLSVEVAEIMEHFQWLSPEEAKAIAGDDDSRTEVAHEIADATCYLLALCNALGIDLAEAIQNKMVLNRQKYPAEESRGHWSPPSERTGDDD